MGSPSVPPPNWNPANTGYADSTYKSALGGLSSLANLGYGTAGRIASNPYAGAQQAGAGRAGGYMTGTLAPEYYGSSRNLYNAVNTALPYSRSILQQGFDPQRALYRQQFQQNQDQTLAAEAAQGVNQSPFGAGVTAQSDLNFNLGWQNQQLGREATALGAYGGFLGDAGRGYGEAGSLGSSGAQAYYTGAGLPYSTYLGQQQNTLGGYGAASNLGTAATGAAGNYLNLANQQYGTQALPYYGAQYQQSQGLWSGLGTLAGLGTGSANNTLGGSALSWLGGFF